MSTFLELLKPTCNIIYTYERRIKSAHHKGRRQHPHQSLETYSYIMCRFSLISQPAEITHVWVWPQLLLHRNSHTNKGMNLSPILTKSVVKDVHLLLSFQWSYLGTAAGRGGWRPRSWHSRWPVSWRRCSSPAGHSPSGHSSCSPRSAVRWISAVAAVCITRHCTAGHTHFQGFVDLWIW